MANEFIARKGLIVLANGAKVTGSLGVQGDINATGYNVTASNLQLLGSASINGDITVGGNLTVGNADLDVVKFLAEVSSSIVPDVNNAFDLGSGSKYWKDLYVSGTAFVHDVKATNITGSMTGSFTGNVTATTFSFDIDSFGSDLTGITVAGTDKLLLSDGGTDGRINVSQLATPLAGNGLEENVGTIRIASSAAGAGLTGGSGNALAVGAGSGITVNPEDVELNTGSAHFLGGVKSKLNADGVFSSSVQTDVRNTTGIQTIATTGSNTFIGSQTVFGDIFLSGSNRLVYNNTDNTSLLFGFYDGSTIRGPYYQIFGNNYADATQRGSAEFVFDTRNSGGSGFNIAGFDGTTWTRRFRVSPTGVQVTGSFEVTSGGITGSILSTNGVVSSSAQVTALLPAGTVSSSGQVDVRNTTGIATIATTGSNTFTGIQSITDSTNSTNYADGALVVTGGVGIGKDVNISGSLNVIGLLTAVSTSIQYVTSSQLNIGVSRVTVNDDDLIRFAGLSVIDSGSTFGTGSLLWDSLNNRWIAEADDANYESAALILGPKNFGTLGDEPVLVDNRVPVGFSDHHIDNRLASSSIRVDFPSRLTHIEAGLYVTGAVTSSVGFSGDGSNLTGIVTNLNFSGSQGGTGTVSLKTQDLIVSGTNGIVATANSQTITISGSNATTTAKGVASFTGSNFTVTGGEVAAKAITFNGVPLDLGSSYSFGLQNITPQGASTDDQVTLNGGAVIHGTLFTSGSNSDIDSGTVIVTSIGTGSRDVAFFDYVVKKGSNYRAGTVMAVWDNANNVEFTDTSTNDLGNTNDVAFIVDALSGAVRLKASVTSNDWIVKTAIRAF